MPLDTFYSGYTGAVDRNRQANSQGIQDMGHAQGILSNMQKMQEQQQVKAILNDPQYKSLEEAAPALMKTGPMGQEMAQRLYQIQEHKAKAAAGAREEAFRSPENLAKFTTPGQPAQPAVTPNFANDDEGNAMPSYAAQPAIAPKLDQRALFEAGAAQGIPHAVEGLKALETRDLTRETRGNTLTMQMMDLQRKAEADKRASEDRNLSIQERAAASKRHDETMRFLGQLTNQTRMAVSDNAAANREILRPWQLDTIINRFETHPEVKKVSALLPEVQVVNNAFKARQEAPVAEKATYDNNLVNAFMRATHPRGGQINKYERADVGALGDVGARIKTGILSFFEGKQLPDDVAAQMVNVINDKFNAASTQVRQLHQNVRARVQSAGGDPELVRDPFAATTPQARRASDNPATVNAKGWKLMTDAQGNKAYVGPKGEIEEVK